MNAISFWLVALGAPLTVVAANVFARLLGGIPQSAPSDTTLALVIFDFVVIVQSQDFKEYVLNNELKSGIVAIYGLLIIVGLVIWAISVFVVEKSLVDYEHRKSINQFVNKNPIIFNRSELEKLKLSNITFPFWPYFGSVMLPIFYLFSNLAPFVVSK